jgi:hypothetical protein
MVAPEEPPSSVVSQFHYRWWTEYATPAYLFFGSGIFFLAIYAFDQQLDILLLLGLLVLLRAVYIVYFGLRKVPLRVELLTNAVRFVFPFRRMKTVSYSDIVKLYQGTYWKCPNAKLTFADGSTLLILASTGSVDFDPLIQELKRRNLKLGYI